ncbi:carbohydrate sulfotransferase 12-like isoform X1 [Hippoglossus hippoglossus]|uniref:carbohydrate sulfotransferase 12-like isoform X1 n=1 Tax=Hippoglossus hippoglossus TaxID=8267 RepID=UPI00148E2A26|nr:carbohydrate sulfotransferase 12-like isoform X1 [Hippoglossus hippoglossus]XP_034450981.1 carbohydrate sulfotransferase 12-like isoform X1 [Hippoglossus hippoglossus]
MGLWRGLRVAFILGSLFMILLLLVYWDDVRGFSLHPLQDPKHGSPQAASCPLTTAGPSLSPSTARAQTSSSSTVPTNAFKTKLIPEKTRLEEQKQEDKQEQEEETREEDEEKGRSRTSVDVREQEARKQRIKDVCSGQDAVEFPGRTRPFEQIPNRELDHLIVDDTHQIIYCYVPKVACTNWKRVMVILAQSLISPSTGKPYTDPKAVPPELVHNSTLYLTFSKFWHHYGSLSRHLMALKLQHYTKFLFVRDPFVRLISAFRNKFGSPNQEFYKQFGSVMLRRYGNVSGTLPETVAEAFAAGIKPTFEQFVEYLQDPETEQKSIFNEHWRQVCRLCHPCQVGYDFIGRLETLEPDAEHLLKLLKVDHLFHFPSGARNRTAASWEQDWFAQIPITMRRELYKLYEPDFELFGYPKPDSVLHQ